MKIIVDAMGGDNAPLEILKGCQMAIKELGTEIVLVGNEETIKACMEENKISLNCPIINTDSTIEMDDDATIILREKTRSSMAVGLKLLAGGEGDGFVSAGNTGALTVGSTFFAKRISGIKRPVIASMMPTTGTPVLLLDCGANVECRANMLSQFGGMGDAYMKKVMSIESPRIALANNGTEESKGTACVVQAYRLMKKENYNFIGNIEARSIPYGAADVVVADGFTGNVILKMYEGVASAIMGQLKEIFFKNIKTKIAALLLKNSLNDFKARMDYKEYGGAVMLGIRKSVIKAHGSSDARSFKNAIRQCIKFADSGVIDAIQEFADSSEEE